MSTLKKQAFRAMDFLLRLHLRDYPRVRDDRVEDLSSAPLMSRSETTSSAPASPLLHITDIEAAINHWRARSPADAGAALAEELVALAEVYARMVYQRKDEIAEDDMPPEAMFAWLAWYDTTMDTPCIAICSTSQGDATCKGCGRTFGEVQNWLELGPVQKRAVWRRITMQGTALRFTRYKERAGR